MISVFQRRRFPMRREPTRIRKGGGGTAVRSAVRQTISEGLASRNPARSRRRYIEGATHWRGNEMKIAQGQIDASDVTTRLLFPTSQQGLWSPFERFAETIATARKK